MEVYCTACSRKKLGKEEPVAAVDRYVSENVWGVYEFSRREGITFRILSGKFGLLKADDKIPNYDYLLREEDVWDLKERLKRQLGLEGITKLTFFAEDREEHPNWGPYYNAITAACKDLRIPVEFETVGKKKVRERK